MASDTRWRFSSDGIYGAIKYQEELEGILDGIMCDGQVNFHEIVHLATWLREHGKKIDPRLESVLELLDDVAADGTIDTAEQQLIAQTLKQLRLDLRGTRKPFEFEEGLIQHLVGVIKGATSDQAIDDKELHRILQLLDSEVGKTSAFAKSIKSAIERCKNDRNKLVQTLYDIAGHDPSLGIVGGQAIGGIFDDPEDPAALTFSGKNFGFTGTFEYGPRVACIRRVERLGGHFTKHRPDFLVVGSTITRAWASTNYGRKIEAAIKAREQGYPIQLISEAAWDKAARLHESHL